MPSSSALRQQRLAAFAVAACGAVWGLFWIPVQWLESRGIGGSWTSMIFSLMAAAAALPWLVRHQTWRGIGEHSLPGLLLGAGFALYAVSLALTDVLHSLLLFYLTPVWSTIAERIVFGKPLTMARLVAIAMGLGGVASILGVDDGLPMPRNGGDWMALASGMVWAAGTLRSYARPAPGVAVPLLSFGLGGILVSALVLWFARGEPHTIALPEAITGALPWMIPLALVSFVLPTALVLWAAQRIDSGRVGILLMGEALVGSASAALLSGQAFGFPEAMGTALIVGAGLVEVLGRSRS